MPLNHRQVLSLQQKLSPQQIQMIKLLELPVMQLEQRVKQEIEENIVLEEFPTPNESEEEGSDEPPQQISVDEYLREDDTPSYKSRMNNYSKDDKERPLFISGGRSLQEYLGEQLGYRNLSDREMELALFLIGCLDEDGYLRRDLETICDDLAFLLNIECEQAELEGVLNIIQQLEPVGIGARSVQECLLLQINDIAYPTSSQLLARRILMDYFDEFAKRHFEKLISQLQLSDDELRAAVVEIKRLSPKPSNQYSEGGTETTPYITPDFLLVNHDDQFELTLNSGTLPEIKISPRYLDMIRDMVGKNGEVKSGGDREAVQFVKSKIDSAKWFISAIKQRHDTLTRTME
ncbi:MAG: RNA polymerase sigma-54 factor, partial [Rikenellaceae bacterium]